MEIRVGEVYLDRHNSSYLRITEVLEGEVRFFVKEAQETVYKGSYELSKGTFRFNLDRGRFVKWSRTVHVLYSNKV